MNYKNRKYHGDTTRNSRLYRIWLDMKQRCNYEKHESFKDYGGRGIKVCAEWEFDYTCFKLWAIQNGYNDNLSIDRINTNSGYGPNNCRWATLEEQANNTRKNVYLTYCGKTHTLAEWSNILNIGYSTIFARYKRGWSVERILTTKVIKHAPCGTFNANDYYHKNKNKINERRKRLRETHHDEFLKKQREYKAKRKVMINEV